MFVSVIALSVQEDTSVKKKIRSPKFAQKAPILVLDLSSASSAQIQCIVQKEATAQGSAHLTIQIA
jgi:hypothetical protein